MDGRHLAVGKKVDTILEVLGRNVPTDVEKTWRVKKERREPEDRAWEKVTLEEAVTGGIPIGGALKKWRPEQGF